MRRCPRCSRTYPDEIVFCPDDGTALERLGRGDGAEAGGKRISKPRLLKRCSRCNKTYPDEIAFCPEDGTPLERLIEKSHQDGLVGTVVGDRYRIISRLSEGGMGVVYLAEHIMLEKAVAVKVLHDQVAQEEELVYRFLREARSASRIQHSNIVDVIDFGKLERGSFYLVMEYLEGETLDERIHGRGPVAIFDTIGIVNQVCRALQAAHDMGIVHRDLKPENIFLTPKEGRRDLVRVREGVGQGRFEIFKEGHFDFVKVLDFGVAQMIDFGVALTEGGLIFGTPAYVSPEQAQGQAVDHRSDIYSLGVVLYEMLTGVLPFDYEDPVQCLRAHVHKRALPPRVRKPDLGIGYAAERLVLWCLEKDPQDRPGSMEQVREDLQGCYTDVFFRRDAERIPGFVEAGHRPSYRGADMPLGPGGGPPGAPFGPAMARPSEGGRPVVLRGPITPRPEPAESAKTIAYQRSPAFELKDKDDPPGDQEPQKGSLAVEAKDQREKEAQEVAKPPKDEPSWSLGAGAAEAEDFQVGSLHTDEERFELNGTDDDAPAPRRRRKKKKGKNPAVVGAVAVGLVVMALVALALLFQSPPKETTEDPLLAVASAVRDAGRSADRTPPPPDRPPPPQDVAPPKADVAPPKPKPQPKPEPKPQPAPKPKPKPEPKPQPKPEPKPAASSDMANEAYRDGLRFFMRGQPDKAIASYRQALKVNPRHAQANRGLGVIYENKGDSVMAVKHYKAYLAANPSEPPTSHIRKYVERNGR